MARDREKKKQAHKAYRERNRQKLREKNKAYREGAATREKELKRKRNWWRANRNPEEEKKRLRDWSKANPERVTETKRKKRAQIKNCSIPLTAEEEQIILVMERTRRMLQEETGKIHEIDHIIPVHYGGIHHPCNLQVLDRLINGRKRNKITPQALTLVAENYRLYHERSGIEKAEWFRNKIAKAIGLEMANNLIGSEQVAPSSTAPTLEDLLS